MSVNPCARGSPTVSSQPITEAPGHLVLSAGGASEWEGGPAAGPVVAPQGCMHAAFGGVCRKGILHNENKFGGVVS